MKTLAAGATTHLAAERTTLCMIWKITRRDATVLGFTDYHENLTVGGLVYVSQIGMVRATAVSGSSDLSVANADIETVLDSDAIDREDLQAGLYDYADVRISLVNYLSPDAWQIKLLRGRLGEVSMGRNAARTELRSLTELLKQRVGRTHEVACSYELGDAKCGVSLAAFMQPGTISQVINQHRFRDGSMAEVDGWFNQGKITFTTGNCAGLSMEVQRWIYSSQNYVLSLDMPYPLEVGDDYEVTPGCNKTWRQCVDKFSNQNFSGFGHIPGTDYVMSFPTVPSR